MTKGSCINNQILDILKREITRKNKGETTDFLASEIGHFLGTTTEKSQEENKNEEIEKNEESPEETTEGRGKKNKIN